MRTAIAAAVAVTALLSPAVTAPAHAAGGFVAVCELRYGLWGVGTSNGTGQCTVAGTSNGVVVDGSATMSFTVHWNSPCPTTAQYSGSMSGAVDLYFTITRIENHGTITTSGEINGAGTGAFVVTEPVGNPCGGSARETFEFGVAGA